jgi:predicted transcriptional regulator
MGISPRVKVKDIMTPRVISVATSSSLQSVLDEMVKNDVSGVVVLDDRGISRGVISCYDIIAATENRSREEVAALTAEDVMTKYVIDVNPEDDIEKAAAIMKEFKIHRLIIGTRNRPDEQVPVGILTSTDILRTLHKFLFL